MNPPFLDIIRRAVGSARFAEVELFVAIRNRTEIVHTGVVRNITLSADGKLIERARLRAAKEQRTLNAAFREWLQRYAGPETGRKEFESLMKRLSHVRSRGRFSRDEMNQR